MIQSIFSFLRRVLQIRRNFSTTCTILGTRGEKLQVDAALCARSMVEMLGVLAIIGVLSVGAIAGYSKAMFKYRLNKFSETMNMLLNNALQISKSLPKSTVDGEWISHAEIMYKLGLIPDGIKYIDGRTYMYDIFNNPVWVYAYPTYYGIGYEFGSKSETRDTCHALLNIYRENHDQLWYVATDQAAPSDDTGENVITQAYLYGDAYCTDNNRCLQNLTLTDIDELCSNCVENAAMCRFFVSWK